MSSADNVQSSGKAQSVTGGALMNQELRLDREIMESRTCKVGSA
jgi:hypothetical protein